MANCWAGSKHEEYGGYLRNLKAPPASPSPPPDDEWYGKHRPMASWQGYQHAQWGGYLNSLSQPQESTTLPPGKPSDYGNDVRWGAQVYLDSIHSSSSPPESTTNWEHPTGEWQ